MDFTPDMRLERTRAARRPLSRQPSGRGRNVLRLSIAVSVLAVGCGREGWVRTESQAGRYTVSMPGAPINETKLMNAPYGSVEMHISMVRRGNSAFAVTYSDYPPEYLNARTAREILDNARDGAVENTRGTLLTEELIAKDGYSGRDIKISVAGGKATSRDRMFLVGRRLYQLIVAMPVSEPKEADSERFFGSFEVVPERSVK